MSQLFHIYAALAVAAPTSSDLPVDWLRMPFQDHYWLWKSIGGLGLATFSARFMVQWIYSEYHKESRVPTAFWWLSLVGSLLCLAYALRQQDSIFILGYLFNVIPYTRNLILIYRKKREQEIGGLAVSSADHK
jgi:lipid-A-disaccharide synthase-like uncharacterized protein